MVRSLFILLALALVCFTSAKKPTFLPSRTSANALSVRGGAGPLDPTDTAKLGMLLAGTHSTLTLLSPSRTLKEYGAPSNPRLEGIALWQGENVLGFCLMAYFLIVRGSDHNTAVAASVVPCLLSIVKVLWNDDPNKLGFSAGPFWVMLVMAGVILHALVMDAPYVDTAIKFLVVFTLINGVVMAVAPGTAGEAYGMNAYPESNAAFKTFGHMLLGQAIFTGAVCMYDVDPIKAFGYGWIPALLLQISNNFVTKENDQFNVRKLPSYLWMLIDAVIVITCGFSKSLDHPNIHSTL